MKGALLVLATAVLLMSCGDSAPQIETALVLDSSPMGTATSDALLRHVVLFKFKPETTPADVAEIESTFNGLPAQIPTIQSFEWGINNSPEGLDKGFTHAYFLTFASVADRDAYLPHPAHKAFGDVVGPHIEDLTVVDYWAQGAGE